MWHKTPMYNIPVSGHCHKTFLNSISYVRKLFASFIVKNWRKMQHDPACYKRQMLKICDLHISHLWQPDIAILFILSGTILAFASSKSAGCWFFYNKYVDATCLWPICGMCDAVLFGLHNDVFVHTIWQTTWVYVKISSANRNKTGEELHY